ncbi:MAG: hypothetical protein WCT01_01785 [Candidatus Shapirobacteria bacterium]
MEIQSQESFSDVTPRVTVNPPPSQSSAPTATPSSKPKPRFHLPKNPKYKLLVGLGILVFVLLVLSIIVPKRSPVTPRALPTPTLSTQPTAPVVNNIEIPSELKDSFAQIESRLNEIIIPALPPEIDLKIGNF